MHFLCSTVYEDSALKQGFLHGSHCTYYTAAYKQVGSEEAITWTIIDHMTTTESYVLCNTNAFLFTCFVVGFLPYNAIGQPKTDRK